MVPLNFIHNLFLAPQSEISMHPEVCQPRNNIVTRKSVGLTFKNNNIVQISIKCILAIKKQKICILSAGFVKG